MISGSSLKSFLLLLGNTNPDQLLPRAGKWSPQKAGEKKLEIILDLTQNELADYFGVARPSVGRALGQMEVEDIIKVNAKIIRIINRKKLMDLTID